MRVIEGVLGNVREDDDLAAARERHAEAGTLETVELDPADRVRSRLRVTTDAGTELGVVVAGDELREGDVLVRDDDAMVVLAFAEREAYAVELPATADPATLVELGHAIGNQHWDLAVVDGTAYVPLDADREIVEDVLADAVPALAESDVETVPGSLFVANAGHSAASDREHGHVDHDHAHTEHGHAHDDHSHAEHGHAEHEHAEHGHADHSHAEHEHAEHGHADNSHAEHEHAHGGDHE